MFTSFLTLEYFLEKLSKALVVGLKREVAGSLLPELLFRIIRASPRELLQPRHTVQLTRVTLYISGAKK